MATHWQAEGMTTVMPYLLVKDTKQQLDFLTTVFDGTVMDKHLAQDGSINHAEVKIGDTTVMMGQVGEDGNPSNNSLYVYVPDTDAAYNKAIAAGATSMMEPSDQFYGDRNAGVIDPAGNIWFISTHLEDVTPEEMRKRIEAHEAERAKQAEQG